MARNVPFEIKYTSQPHNPTMDGEKGFRRSEATAQIKKQRNGKFHKPLSCVKYKSGVEFCVKSIKHEYLYLISCCCRCLLLFWHNFNSSKAYARRGGEIIRSHSDKFFVTKHLFGRTKPPRYYIFSVKLKIPLCLDPIYDIYWWKMFVFFFYYFPWKPKTFSLNFLVSKAFKLWIVKKFKWFDRAMILLLKSPYGLVIQRKVLYLILERNLLKLPAIWLLFESWWLLTTTLLKTVNT